MSKWEMHLSLNKSRAHKKSSGPLLRTGTVNAAKYMNPTIESPRFMDLLGYFYKFTIVINFKFSAIFVIRFLQCHSPLTNFY